MPVHCSSNEAILSYAFLCISFCLFHSPLIIPFREHMRLISFIALSTSLNGNAFIDCVTLIDTCEC